MCRKFDLHPAGFARLPAVTLLLIVVFALHVGAQTKPSRIVSTTLATDEIVAALVEPSRIVAVSQYAANPQISNIADVARKINVVADRDAERIVRLQPDIILSTRYTKTDLNFLMQQTRIPYVELSRFETVADIESNIRTIGKAVHEEHRADELIGEMRRKVAGAATGRRLEGPLPRAGRLDGGHEDHGQRVDPHRRPQECRCGSRHYRQQQDQHRTDHSNRSRRRSHRNRLPARCRFPEIAREGSAFFDGEGCARKTNSRASFEIRSDNQPIHRGWCSGVEPPHQCIAMNRNVSGGIIVGLIAVLALALYFAGSYIGPLSIPRPSGSYGGPDFTTGATVYPRVATDAEGYALTIAGPAHRISSQYWSIDEYVYSVAPPENVVSVSESAYDRSFSNVYPVGRDVPPGHYDRS